MRIRLYVLLSFMVFSSGAWSQTDKQKFAVSLATGTESQQKDLAVTLFNTYSSFTYTYYRLLLTALPKNAVLISNSYDDTFPISILQLSQNTRPDVKVIGLSMLSDSNYLTRINQQHKIQLTGVSDFQRINYLKNNLKSVYISTTVKSNLWYHPSNFLMGLTVHTKSTEQLKMLNNFYSSYKKLKLKSYTFVSSDLSIIRNILPPLITLYKLDAGNDKLRDHIIELAKMVNKSELVEKMIALE